MQGVVSAPYDWGLAAALVAYQQAFDGSARSLTIQPFLFYNLSDGFYLRSSGITTIDFGRQRAVVPVGFGLGRVKLLDNGNVLNMYLEPQYSVVQSGIFGILAAIMWVTRKVDWYALGTELR